MAAPAVTSTVAYAYGQLPPRYVEDDESTGWVTLHLLAAALAPLQDVDDLVRDDGDTPGWAPLLDIDRAPVEFLPFLAQMVGVRLRSGLSAVAQRQRITEAAGIRRGTLEAMRAAAQAYLVGDRKVSITERLGADPYAILVRTYASETPEPAMTEAAIRNEKPAGIILTYQVVTGAAYLDVSADFVTYNNLNASFASYEALARYVPAV